LEEAVSNILTPLPQSDGNDTINNKMFLRKKCK